MTICVVVLVNVMRPTCWSNPSLPLTGVVGGSKGLSLDDVVAVILPCLLEIGAGEVFFNSLYTDVLVLQTALLPPLDYIVYLVFFVLHCLGVHLSGKSMKIILEEVCLVGTPLLC